MACGKKCSEDTSLETLAVLTELKNIFRNCDVNGSEEVEIRPLVNQMCLVLPVIENQEELKQKLFQLLTPSGESTVKRQKFEECMLEWIEIVYGRNDCSSLAEPHSQCLCSHAPKIYNSSRKCFTRNKLRNKTSTPLLRTISYQDHFDDSTGDIEFHNEKSTSNGLLNLQMVKEEEISTLRQRNPKLETMIDVSQISKHENSPCKNCEIMQSKIDKLNRTIEKEIEANNKYYVELAKFIGYKEENQRLLHKIVVLRKTEESLQSKMIELQIQSADLIDNLKKEQGKGERNMKLIKELQQDKAEAEMLIENTENKLIQAMTETESLKAVIRNLEEHISTHKNHLRAPMPEEESSSVYVSVIHEQPSSSPTPSTETLSLLQELRNVVPPYGFTDVSTQTQVLSEFDMKIVNNFQEQTYSGELQGLLEEQEQEYFHQLKISRQESAERFPGWTFLYLIIVPLVIALLIYLLSDTDTLSNCTEFFYIKFKYLKPPPI